MERITEFKYLLKNTAKEWVKHNPLLIGSAISFYIILSLGPILAVIILTLGEIYGVRMAQGQIVNEIRSLLGDKVSELLHVLIQRASTSSNRTMAVISSIPLIFFGTTMVFFQVRNALNIIWDIKDNTKGVKGKIKSYSFSFIMLLVVGAIFFLMTLKSPFLEQVRSFSKVLISLPPFLFKMLDLLLTYIIITLLFAAVYKVLTKAEIGAKALWTGAAVTSFLFSIVQVFVGFNAENSNIDSAFGALGSFTILLLWIFYSSLVFLFGACFTKVYAGERGYAAKRVSASHAEEAA